MKAFLNSKTKNHMNLATIQYGMDRLGVEYEMIDEYTGEYSDNYYFYGNVGYIQRLCEHLNITLPAIAHVPEELYEFSGRTLEYVSLSEALERSRNSPMFIKPCPSNHKKFTGLVLDGPRSLLNVSDYGDDETVILSPVLNIISEWRCFVLDGELIGSRFYHGDFRVSPNYSIVEKMIKTWKSSPVAYSLDVGITEEGNTFVVECNDVMCLGWYGFLPTLSARMVISRWDEIYKNNL